MVLAMTTKVDVKAVLKRTSAVDDTVIDDLILQVSKEAEEFMGRHLLTAARTETYTLRPGQTFLSLRGFPITSVGIVKYGSSEDFTDVEALDASVYSVRSGLGQIRFRTEAFSFSYSPGFVEVTYTGGLALTTAAFKTAEPRLEFAARTEVINRFNRSTNPEGSLQMLGTGVGYQSAMKPLEDFYVALGHRRRLRL